MARNATVAVDRGPASTQDKSGHLAPVASQRAREVHVQASRWIPQTDHDVFAYATDTEHWPQWLPATTERPCVLSEPPDYVEGTFTAGSTEVEVVWRVRRRLRNTVTLDAITDGRIVATLVMSFSCWYDGCMAELRLTSQIGTRIRMRPAIHRSLRQLEECARSA